MTEEEKIAERFKQYPSTDKFKVVDTMGVPHLYCLTPKHLEYADYMYLDGSAIERAEKKGAVCDICRGLNRAEGTPILPWAEHKRALVVEVDDARQPSEIPELLEYVNSIRELAIKDGYAGFGFVQARKAGLH